MKRFLIILHLKSHALMELEAIFAKKNISQTEVF